MKRIALFVLLAVAGCGDDSDSTPRTPKTAAGSPSAREPLSIPRYGGHYSRKLDPGEYIADRFEPPVRLTLGRGWGTALGVEQSKDIIGLQRDADVTLYITGAHTVFRPGARSVADTARGPSDVSRFLTRHPLLDARRHGAITVAGSKAEVIDATVSGLAPYRPAECDSPCLPIFDTSSGLSVNVRRGMHARFWVFKSAEMHLVATLQAPERRVAAAARAAAEVLRSMRFDT